MVYIIEEHDTLPLIQTTWNPDFRFERDAVSYVGEVKAILDSKTEPVFYMMDIVNWTRMSFQELIEATSMAAGGNFKHPKNRGTVIITKDKTVGMAIKGMDSDAFGHVKLKVVDNMDDAIAFVQERV